MVKANNPHLGVLPLGQGTASGKAMNIAKVGEGVAESSSTVSLQQPIRQQLSLQQSVLRWAKGLTWRLTDSLTHSLTHRLADSPSR